MKLFSDVRIGVVHTPEIIKITLWTSYAINSTYALLPEDEIDLSFCLEDAWAEDVFSVTATRTTCTFSISAVCSADTADDVLVKVAEKMKYYLTCEARSLREKLLLRKQKTEVVKAVFAKLEEALNK